MRIVIEMTVPPLVALHGFTLCGALFARFVAHLRRPVIAPDLPGHGAAADVPASFDAAVDLVAAYLPAPLLGYSMGGRIALMTALERPELVPALVLVSASPGAVDAPERQRRDAALADRIEEVGVAAFLDEWLAQPMFVGLTDDMRALRLTNTAAGLAAALRGLGQGAMPYLGDRLGELRMPVLLVAGERDERYAELARWMASRIPDARVAVVTAAGHGVVGEAPRELADLVGEFLDSEHMFG